MTGANQGGIRGALGRRARAVRGVLAASLRYVAENAGEMEWRDALAFPAAVAVFLAAAVCAPGALSEEGVLDASPHGPIGVREAE